MESIEMTIGSVLKDKRIGLNIKQDDLAEQLGVTVQTVSKWERDITEPKASQVNRLSQILKMTEREICQGELEGSDLDEMEFVRRVGILISEVPETEMLFGLHKYINDRKGFLNMLSKVSSYPYELFEVERKESEKVSARLQLELLEKGQITNIDDFTKEQIEELKERLRKMISEE